MGTPTGPIWLQKIRALQGNLSLVEIASLARAAGFPSWTPQKLWSCTRAKRGLWARDAYELAMTFDAPLAWFLDDKQELKNPKPVRLERAPVSEVTTKTVLTVFEELHGVIQSYLTQAVRGRVKRCGECGNLLNAAAIRSVGKRPSRGTTKPRHERKRK